MQVMQQLVLRHRRHHHLGVIRGTRGGQLVDELAQLPERHRDPSRTTYRHTMSSVRSASDTTHAAGSDWYTASRPGSDRSGDSSTRASSPTSAASTPSCRISSPSLTARPPRTTGRTAPPPPSADRPSAPVPCPGSSAESASHAARTETPHHTSTTGYAGSSDPAPAPATPDDRPACPRTCASGTRPRHLPNGGG